jgi:hypothetical protein
MRQAEQPGRLAIPRVQTLPRLQAVPDEFERDLLTDIAEAESFGEGELAVEWRLELKSYRAAKQQAFLEDQAWGGSSAVARREALRKRQSDQP